MGAGFPERLVEGQKQAWEQWAEIWPELHFHAPQPPQALRDSGQGRTAWRRGRPMWRPGDPGVGSHTQSPPTSTSERRVGTLPFLVDPWAQK